ncbi:HIT domain-containing protein [Candidatus Woesearchaeota archaeon]|nr:HIT domain-containing protein [Candidatus Woesearchaeota archaeon]
MLAAQREAALPPPGPKDCVFCRRTQTPVKTSTHFYAQWDTRPVAKGHALVIPFRHVTSYFDLSTDEAAELHALIKSTKTHIDSMHRPDGYNVGVNDGEWAGQTTPHLHVHILPRYKGDVAAPVGGIRRILSR